MVQCGNECGEMLDLENPALILIGLDVEMELPVGMELPQSVPLFALIPRICPKCGHYINVQFFTQEDFERYSQKRLLIELKDGEVFIVRKPKEAT